MKLISKFCVAVAAMLVTAAASAGTLYWQVTSDTGVEFSTARIVVLDTTDNDNRVATLGETTATDFDSSSGTGTYLTMQQTDISRYTDNQYSFFVEMVNYTTDPVSYKNGYTFSYDELLSAHYVSFDATDVQIVSAAASAGNMGSSVPEPSSGLLLLMGGALLALRRRRQK